MGNKKKIFKQKFALDFDGGIKFLYKKKKIESQFLFYLEKSKINFFDSRLLMRYACDGVIG
jgi:hypothetical protein